MRIRSLSIRNILWLTVSVLTLLIALLVGREVLVQWQQLQKIESLKEATLFSDILFDAIEKISVERDVAFAMLHAPDNQDTSDLRSRLAETRRDADAIFISALTPSEQFPFPELEKLRKNIEMHLIDIRELRPQIDRALALPKRQREDVLAGRWYGEVTALISEAQNLWIQFIRHFTDINPIVTQHLRYKHFLLIISDYTARERSLIGRLLVENASPSPEEIGQLLRWQGTIDLAWKSARLLAEQSGLYAQIGPYFKDAESQYQTMYDMVHDIFYVPGREHGASYPISIDLWFELSTQSADSLNALKAASKIAKHQYVEKLESEARYAIEMHLSVLLLALGLCSYCFWVISHRVIRPINAMIEALVDATHGKPVSFMPQIGGGHNEISKLADVLHVFQQNMDEIRRTSVMLENYTHALERSNKELDDFAYIASHDLKEPLRGIHNHSRFLLEDNQGKLDEDSVRKLDRLIYLSQRMERLVNDLLYFSRLGRQELAVQSTDVNDIIHDIEKTLEVFLEERHGHITIAQSLPVITCDKTRVTELFRNLITNAIKYNDKSEKNVEMGFLPSREAPDKIMYKHVFYVRDNGKGIAPEFHEEVFRIFKRLQSAKPGEEEGTGVGLTFVKKIVERHGGHIWLESETNAGTTFYFTLEGYDSDIKHPGASA